MLAIASASPTIAICRATPPVVDSAASTGGLLELGSTTMFTWRRKAGIDAAVGSGAQLQARRPESFRLVNIGVDGWAIARILGS